MRTIIQRVHQAEITIDYEEKRKIKQGLVVFLGVLKGDTEKQSAFLADKICNLRIFKDSNDKMNLSLKDIDGEILIVSNFTLATDCAHGRRPSFDNSAPFDEANHLYEHFIHCVKDQAIRNVQTGKFASHMDVEVHNDGPVNIILDTEKIGK